MADAFGWRDFQTGDLLSNISPTEYAALGDAAKDGLRIIISAGLIDFRENSAMWNAIHAIFPDGTASWTAIKEFARASKS
jgi:hypothetical protein